MLPQSDDRSSVQYLPDESKAWLGTGEDKAGIMPGGLPEYRFSVGKGFETGFAMILSHATVADASKGQEAGCHLHYGAVYAAASIGKTLGQPLLGCAVPGEYIQGQRFGQGADAVFHFIQVAVVQNRQDGPEYFILHQV